MYKKMYREKLVSPEKAAEVVKSGDWVDYSFCLGQPIAIDKALAKRKEELVDVKIRGGIRMSPLAVIEADPKREHFIYNSWHFSGLERKLCDQGLCNYIPMLYRNLPLYYRKSLQVDVAFLSVSPIDEAGYFSFSLTNSASMAIVEKAAVVVIEVQPNLPVVKHGQEEKVHIDQVDFIVENIEQPLSTLPEIKATEAELKIATSIMAEIPDGATIQLGIGGLPNTIGTMLAKSDLRDLGFHTEMLVDAYRIMDEAGKLTNMKKSLYKGKGVFSFCAGSESLYEWVRNNDDIAACPVNYVNDPAVIAQLDNFISINNCIEVDLYGQVTAEASGKRQISGTGGQLDFLTGAYLSNGGKGFIALTSTFTDRKTGELKSRLVPSLPEFTAITNPRTQAHYLVTEWGIADLAGRSTWERAERVIEIAHPKFHESLIQEADKLGIWCRSNKRI